MRLRLAIDYGTATVRAVLVAPGSTIVLRLDGIGAMSTAVHVSSAGIVAGAQAWRRASSEPQGFVGTPLRAGTGQVSVAGREVEVADLVAATLRQVVAEAQRVAGRPLDDVRLVVPPGWGPRRRTWLRHAARAAGLPTVRLVEAPVAVLSRRDVPAVPLSPTPALVIDVGAGCTVSVVQPGVDGGEVLSTLDDPEAGGDCVDGLLLQSLIGTLDGRTPADHRTALADVQVARHTLSDQAAVTMPMPDGQPPMVISSRHVSDAARPVFERVADLAVQVLANADLTAEQISGVHLIGGVAVTPGAAETIAARLGAPVQAADRPQLAAVLGAAEAGADHLPAAKPPRLPPLRRLVTLALPGVASLALYAHFVLDADFYNGTPRSPRAEFYVLASWGELTVAAVLALITALQAATLFAMLLEYRSPGSEHRAGSRISGGISAAIVAGLACAALYAVAAAVLFHQPIGALMRWSLLPVLPIALAAGAVALLARWRGTAPTGGWDAFLAFPASATLTATAGVLAVAMWWHSMFPGWLNGWRTSIGLAGGLLVGVAVACMVVRHPAGRLALLVPIGVFTTIISRSGPDILAVIWAIGVALWWAWHAWALSRTPVAGPTGRPGTVNLPEGPRP